MGGSWLYNIIMFMKRSQYAITVLCITVKSSIHLIAVLEIGETDECWEALIIVLVMLNPSIPFKNQMYFEGKTPRRLMRSNEIP